MIKFTGVGDDYIVCFVMLPVMDVGVMTRLAK